MQETIQLILSIFFGLVPFWILLLRARARRQQRRGERTEQRTHPSPQSRTRRAFTIPSEHPEESGEATSPEGLAFDEEAMPDPLFATESIWGTQYIIPPMAERQKRAGQEVRPPESTREENIRAPAEAMREEEERARERLLHDEEINHRDKEQNTSASVPEKSETHTRHSRATLHDLRLNIARDTINVQKLSPAELQRAVILSEILSAPRSLKSLHFD